jgi:fucose permease
MLNIPRDAPQSIGYVSYGISMTQMTKKHAHQVRPAVDAFAVFIGSMLFNNAAEQFSWD